MNTPEQGKVDQNGNGSLCRLGGNLGAAQRQQTSSSTEV
jgi:hypothetical protein